MAYRLPRLHRCFTPIFTPISVSGTSLDISVNIDVNIGVSAGTDRPQAALKQTPGQSFWRACRSNDGQIDLKSISN